jgi:hypothetical protein
VKAFALALVCALACVRPVPAQDSAAVAVVRSFYAWDFAQRNGDWTTHFDEAKQFFRPSLYALLRQALVKQAKTNDVILDFDPFVNAQSNATGYELGTPVDKGSVTLIPVTLTIPHWTSKTHLTMAVSRSSGGYAIYDVLYTNPTFNLRGYLQKALSN